MHNLKRGIIPGHAGVHNEYTSGMGDRLSHLGSPASSCLGNDVNETSLLKFLPFLINLIWLSDLVEILGMAVQAARKQARLFRITQGHPQRMFTVIQEAI